MKTCTKCKLEKEESEFYFIRSKNSLYSWCKSCACASNREDKAKFMAEHGYGHTTQWRRKDPNNILKSNKWDRDRNAEIKRQLVDGYGGVCTCCGESEIAFLTLEHKNKDGQKHRAEVSGKPGRGGVKVYKDVISKGFPIEFTILCMNCNFAEKDGKQCPHKENWCRNFDTTHGLVLQN